MTRPQNRLANEASPYLLQHAGNPVDWYPWGAEALARAAADDKPILLSIGYSACHWCHVMERESFEDEAIARVMNERFVCIKVDREERPDLDQIYQLVVQLMGRSGGWPLTVFLTPSQRPFFGGTYFPPIARYGVPAFPTLLHAVSDAYREKRDEVTAQADELTAAIAKVTQHEAHAPEGGEPPYALGPDLLERVSAKLSARFDEEHGGFGSRPKFPNTMPLDVLLHRGALELEPRALARVRYALLKMREGGIYDQLGGGFHRYSTDERWLVPHFEKMLYDNALLLRLYADAYRVTSEGRFADTAREIVAYAVREMTDLQGDGGGFYATQDADSEGGEGKFFVWSPEEIRAALPDDREAAEVVTLRYGVTSEGNFEHTGKSVLHGAKSLEAVANTLGLGLAAAHSALGRARAALFPARESRVKPPRDEKILASWNALFLGALADAGAALDEPTWITRASRAFAFVEEHLVHDGAGHPAGTRVDRHVKRSGDGTFARRGPGFLDDYAYLADAALDLWETTGEVAYLKRAQGLADALLEKFFDGATSEGGFYFTAAGGERLIHRAKDPFDHAVPSGTAMACKALLRLGTVMDAKYTVPAEATLKALAPAAEGNPFGFGQLIVVLDRLVRGSVDVVIAGHGPSEAATALGRVALRAYQPNRNLVWLLDDASREACAAIREGKEPGAAGPVAYVCKGRACSLPVSEPEALAKLLGG